MALAVLWLQASMIIVLLTIRRIGHGLSLVSVANSSSSFRELKKTLHGFYQGHLSCGIKTEVPHRRRAWDIQ